MAVDSLGGSLRAGALAMKAPKEKTDLNPESSGKRLQAHTGDTQAGFLHQPGQDQSVQNSIAVKGVQ